MIESSTWYTEKFEVLRQTFQFKTPFLSASRSRKLNVWNTTRNLKSINDSQVKSSFSWVCKLNWNRQKSISLQSETGPFEQVRLLEKRFNTCSGLTRNFVIVQKQFNVFKFIQLVFIRNIEPLTAFGIGKSIYRALRG